MKRDMDLIRKILLRAEECETGRIPNGPIDGYDEAAVGYHNYLIVDAGLADGCDATTLSDTGPNWMLTHLTSAGHDFLDASREPKRWNEAKKVLGNATIGAYVGLLNKLAIYYASKAAGIEP